MKKINFKIVKDFFRLLKRHWRTRFCLVIRNEETHKEKFKFSLSVRNIFVVTVSGAVLLIFITTIVIAFTSLRYYIPGYIDPDKYKEFRLLTLRIDSLERTYDTNQNYIKMFSSIVSEKELDEGNDIRTDSSKTKKISDDEIEIRKRATNSLYKDADEIFNNNKNQQINQQFVSNRKNLKPIFKLSSPVNGKIIKHFNIADDVYGISVKNAEQTIIKSVSDGMVIYSGYDSERGNTVIVQHRYNLISVYQHNYRNLVSTGAKIKAGTPVALMGKTGFCPDGVNLFFSIWNNGVPENPLDFFAID